MVTAGVHVLSPGQKVKLYVDPGNINAAGAGVSSGASSVAVPVTVK